MDGDAGTLMRHLQHTAAVDFAAFQGGKGFVVVERLHIQLNIRRLLANGFQNDGDIRQNEREERTRKRKAQTNLPCAQAFYIGHHGIVIGDDLFRADAQIGSVLGERKMVARIDKQRRTQLLLHRGDGLTEGLAGNKQRVGGLRIIEQLGGFEKITELGNIHGVPPPNAGFSCVYKANITPFCQSVKVLY